MTRRFKYQMEFTGVSIASAPAMVVSMLISNWQLAGTCAAMLAADFIICALRQYYQYRRENKA